MLDCQNRDVRKIVIKQNKRSLVAGSLSIILKMEVRSQVLLYFNGEKGTF